MTTAEALVAWEKAAAQVGNHSLYVTHAEQELASAMRLLTFAAPAEAVHAIGRRRIGLRIAWSEYEQVVEQAGAALDGLVRVAEEEQKRAGATACRDCLTLTLDGTHCRRCAGYLPLPDGVEVEA